MRIGRQRSGGQSGDNPVFGIGLHRLFEQPSKPKINERDRALAKKRQDLDRVLESLKAPDVSAGLAKELRRHQALLAAEIAELDRYAHEGRQVMTVWRVLLWHVLWCCGHRRTGAQPGDLSLDLDMGDASWPSRLFASPALG
jgi:hypothetical protein